MSISRYINGDITETELTYIAHGVNCQNRMGSGVAKALFTRFPEVKIEYHKLFDDYFKPSLGEIDYVQSGDKYIINCFTQFNYGYDGKRYVNYAAVAQCFESIRIQLKGEIIAIPKIGCGLAGGNWEFMEQLINDAVGDDVEIWVYQKD